MINIDNTSYNKEYAYNLNLRKRKRSIFHKEDGSYQYEELESLIDEIELSYQDIRVILNHFEQTIEPDLVEYYIYQYKAAQIKHDYLLRCIKETYYKIKVI